MMDLSNFHPSDIVQMPAIVQGGRVLPLGPKFSEMPEQAQKEYALAIGGQLIYIKMQAVYEELPKTQRLCIKRDCWRPADYKNDSDYCDDHGK